MLLLPLPRDLRLPRMTNQPKLVRPLVLQQLRPRDHRLWGHRVLQRVPHHNLPLSKPPNDRRVSLLQPRSLYRQLQARRSRRHILLTRNSSSTAQKSGVLWIRMSVSSVSRRLIRSSQVTLLVKWASWRRPPRAKASYHLGSRALYIRLATSMTRNLSRKARTTNRLSALMN